MHKIGDLVPSTFTELQRRSVVSRLRSGETVSQVAKELDLHPKHIHAICALEKRREQEEIIAAEIEEQLKEKVVDEMVKKFGRPDLNKKYSEANHVYERGMPMDQVTEKFKVTEKGLSSWRYTQKKKGVKIKNMSGANRKSTKVPAKKVTAPRAAKPRLPSEASKIAPPIIQHSKIAIEKYEEELRRLWTENMNLRIELMRYR